MNTMNNYEYNEGIEFNGLMPKVMEADGVKTIGASDFNAKLFENGHLGGGSLEAVDFLGTAFGENGGGEDDKHKYVDLGLPSGTLWATTNIQDADGNELYFAWGETQGYTAEQVGTDKYFAWDGENADYKYGAYNDSDEQNWGMEKYNKNDGKIVLDAEDDAATANWGSGWKMPTEEQFDELIANTTTVWTQVDGVNGLLCTSTANTNTLFFPAVGSSNDGKVYSLFVSGRYWSVSLQDEYVSGALGLNFVNANCLVGNARRCYGYSVRPVRSNN